MNFTLPVGIINIKDQENILEDTEETENLT